jgi:hypothetical protein
MPIPTAPIPHSNLAQKTGGNRSAFKGYDSQKKLDFAANFLAVNTRPNKKSRNRTHKNKSEETTKEPEMKVCLANPKRQVLYRDTKEPKRASPNSGERFFELSKCVGNLLESGVEQKNENSGDKQRTDRKMARKEERTRGSCADCDPYLFGSLGQNPH